MATARFRMAANAAMASDNPPNAQGSSKARGTSEFHPTVVSLMILVAVEYAGFVFMRHYFRHAHGG